MLPSMVHSHGRHGNIRHLGPSFTKYDFIVCRRVTNTELRCRLSEVGAWIVYLSPPSVQYMGEIRAIRRIRRRGGTTKESQSMKHIKQVTVRKADGHENGGGFLDMILAPFENLFKKGNGENGNGD